MIEKYISYLKEIRGYSENTAKAYEKDLRHFAKWMLANIAGARWSTITRAEIDAYIMSQSAAGLAPATTNRRLSAIAGIYNYMKREGHDIENPCKYESRRKQERTIPNTIRPEQLKTAYEHAAGISKVMLGLLITTGMRIGEMLAMTWEDIDWKERSIRIHGKGNKQRIVYTTAEALEILKCYQTYYSQSGIIFQQDQRTARHMLWESLRRYCTAAQLSPHAIRHTFATNIALQGANVTTLAAMMGHSQIQTTQKYIDMTQTEQRDIVDHCNILN